MKSALSPNTDRRKEVFCWLYLKDLEEENCPRAPSLKEVSEHVTVLIFILWRNWNYCTKKMAEKRRYA